MPDSVVLRGRVTRGEQVSCLFTELPWVKRQFREKLKINPYPGTFNLEIIEEDLDRLASLHRQKGIEIVPKDPRYCVGKSFRALVQGRIEAVVLLPDVSHYPASKLELVSAKNIRETLSVKDGDVVTVEVFLPARESNPAEG